MPDGYESPCHMRSLPTELLLKIYHLLPAKDLTKCRQVCWRWKLIIDTLNENAELWQAHCKRDFPSIYKCARQKVISEILWCDLYKSLSLWSKLADATEATDEFASASAVMNEIRSFEVLHDGVIGVLTKSAILYYDMNTLELLNRRSITGTYSRFAENPRALVILNYELHLFILKKTGLGAPQEPNKSFDNVKLFTLTEDALYFVTLDDEIHVYDLCGDENRNSRFIKRSEDNIMALGYTGENLNILTFNKNIYRVINNKLVFACSLGPDCNLFYQLQQYNLLDQMDWRIYVQWMYVFHHKVPEGPFRNLIVVRQYGDMFFVGTNGGVLRIYYAPSFDSTTNLFSVEPVKQYNFMRRSDCPVLSMCPIIGVDVIETGNGHIVLVAMPKKIAVLAFTHNFGLATLPNGVEEVETVKTYCASQS